MLAFSNNIDSELYIIYGLVGLVVLLIIAIIIIDRVEKKREKRSFKSLSDTMQMKPLTEEDEVKETEPTVVPISEVKVDLKNIPEYKEEDLEKTQAQIRIEEINNALKEAGVDDETKENNYDKYDTFEQEQEKNAIISYEELMNSYDKLYEENEKNQYVDDDTIPINIKELYELGEQEKLLDNRIEIKVEDKTEQLENVASPSTFKNSPYISPVYGIEKPITEPKADADIVTANQFLNSLKELKSNLE